MMCPGVNTKGVGYPPGLVVESTQPCILRRPMPTVLLNDHFAIADDRERQKVILFCVPYMLLAQRSVVKNGFL